MNIKLKILGQRPPLYDGQDYRYFGSQSFKTTIHLAAFYGFKEV